MGITIQGYRVRQRARSLGLFLLVAFSYFFFGKLGLRLAVIEPNVTAVWAPTGIAIAVMLLLGYRFLPAVFLAAFAVTMTTGGTVLTSLAIAAGNTLEAIVAAYFVCGFANGIHAFNRVRDVFVYSLSAGMVAPAVGATVGATTLFLAGFVPAAHYASIWFTWWLGDASSALVVAPFIVVWLSGGAFKLNAARIGEASLLGALLLVVAFVGLRGVPGFAYLSLPVFIWGAFRFDQRMTATAIFLLAGVSLFGTLAGNGPFLREFPALGDALLFLEASLAIIFITMMALAAAVAEGKAARTRTDEEKALLDVIIAGIGEGLFVADAEGIIVFINERAADMLACTREDLLGRLYYDAIPAQDEGGNVVPPAQRAISDILAGLRTISATKTAHRYYVRKDGTRFPVSAITTPAIFDGKIVGAIVIFSDATVSHRIDRAKSDFASLVSHQLRTPLSIITMYADLLLRNEKLFERRTAEDCRTYVCEIRDAAHRMATLIAEVSSISYINGRLPGEAMGEVDLERFVGNVMREFAEPIARKRLRIIGHYPPRLAHVSCDAPLLYIVIQNLLTNAIKYTPADGTVALSVVPARSEITITVTDTGYGIPASVQGDVFRKMFRADNVRAIVKEGTGLGLYLVKSIVDRLDGTISFSSKENEGSTFTVRLPVDEYKEKAGS